MSAIPYMPLYVADYLADTAHFSALENGIYLMLIMNYWQRGIPLPANDDSLARIAKVTAKEWTAAKVNILPCFNEQDGHLVHGRIESELQKVRDKSIKNSHAGKVSRSTNAQRTLNERSTPVEQTLNHTDTDTDTEDNTRSAKPSDQFDILEKQLREAAGWEREPHPNLFVIGPIIAAIAGGVDLEMDLLPAAKAHGPRLRTRTSWKYILQAAISNRDNRLQSAADASKPFIATENTRPAYVRQSKPNTIADSFAVVDAAILAERNRIEQLERKASGIGGGAVNSGEGVKLLS